MLDRQKRIAIIFSSDACQPTLTTDSFQRWLNNQIEIGLIAHAVGQVLEPVENAWKPITDYISAHHQEIDGFIVISHSDHLLTNSALMSFMVRGLGKSLIFSGSPNSSLHYSPESLNQDFGLRANLLNSLQVAVLGLKQPAIVFGNRIIHSARAVRSYDSTLNLFQTFDSPLLGSIDFGVHLEDELPYPEQSFQINSQFESKIFVVDNLPGLASVDIPKETKGIIVKSSVTTDWVEKKSNGRPVVVWNASGPVHPQIISLQNSTWEAAVMKFAWVLGQTTQISNIRNLMNKNCIGELGV